MPVPVNQLINFFCFEQHVVNLLHTWQLSIFMYSVIYSVTGFNGYGMLSNIQLHIQHILNTPGSPCSVGSGLATQNFCSVPLAYNC